MAGITAITSVGDSGEFASANTGFLIVGQVYTNPLREQFYLTVQHPR